MHQPGEPSVEVILDSIKRVIARESRPAGNGRGGRGGLPEFERPPEPYEAAPIEPSDADEAAEVLQLDEGEIMPQPHPPLRLADETDAAIPLDDHGGEGDDDLIAYDWSEPEGLGEADRAHAQDGHDQAADRHAALSGQNGTSSPDGEEAPLTNSATRATLRENLAALSMLNTLSRERQARGEDEMSIEALTRDLLRPMLADWLDTNLPPIVERLVQTEIKRIIGEQG